MDESVFLILEFQSNQPDIVVYILVPFDLVCLRLFFKILRNGLLSMVAESNTLYHSFRMLFSASQLYMFVCV
jgi:hypothetical protein